MSRQLSTSLLVVVALAACSSEEGSKLGGDTVGGDGVANDVFFPETGQGDVAPQADTNGSDDTGSDTAAVPDGETTGPCNTFGCACSSNADCLDELCVEGIDGRVCSAPCVTECPGDGFACVPIVLGGSDPFNACVPQHPNLCKPCRQDVECKNELQPNATALCLPAPDPKDGRFCSSSCASGTPCPDGFTCGDVPLDGGGTSKQCIPTDGSCECRPAWASMNLVTDCQRENAVGTCDGERTCGLSGLTACDAPPAAEETCNNQDDDCNGVPDDIAATACAQADNGIGACPGVAACANGALICDGAAAVTEVCNLVDDDCDGATDNGTCGDGLACTDDVCAGVGDCRNPIQPGQCVIGGKCWTENEANPEFPCQRCVPAVSTTAWTGSGDGPSCFIDGQCWPEGAGKEGEPCLRCRPDVSTTTWSPAAAADAIPCDDGVACTQADTCNGGACIGTAYTCDDARQCTDNVCDGAGGCSYPVIAGQCLIDGTCYAEGARADLTTCRVCGAASATAWSAPATALTCDDGDACTSADVCAGATCGGSAYECDDGSACTIDSCDGAGGCVNTPAANFCVIGGECFASGAKNPANPCEGCKTTASATAWTAFAASEHVACDDGKPCTQDDECTAGACLGAPYTCGDDRSCTDDVCDGAGGCSYPVKIGQCLIDDTCYADGARADASTCRICDDATPKAWSPATTALTCDDENACTSSDVCSGLTCSGSPYSCDDGKACTLDACHGSGAGDCSHTLIAGSCLIDGVCYANGASNPQTPCLRCNTGLTTSGWSLAPVDTPCNDGDACTASDVCSFGACFGSRYSCAGLGCCVGDGTCTNVAPVGAVENCSGGIDDDCDGLTDEGTPEQCGDLIDNDCDSLTDESGNTWGETFFARPYIDGGISKIAIYTSNDDGTFQNRKLVQMPDNRVYGIVAIGDFDADKYLDLIVATPDVGTHQQCSPTVACASGQVCQSGVCLTTCSAPANVACPTTISTKTGTCPAGDECFDIDQYGDAGDRCLPPTRVYLVRERCPDGATELIELGIQRRNFIEYPMLKPGEYIQAMVDVNNDGLLDMVVRANWEFNTGSTLFNHGGNIFGRVDNTIKPLQCCGWANALASNPKDIDGDGIVDMVGWCNPNGGSSSAQFAWWKGMGDGYFGVNTSGAWTGLPTAITGGAAAPASLMSTADFDQDGDVDIINGLDDDGNPGSISMLVNRGSGGVLAWATPYVVYDVTPSNTSGSDSPGVGNGTTFDFDRDGFPDLLAGWTPEIVCASGTGWTCPYKEIALIRNLTQQPCGEGMSCNPGTDTCVACTPSCGGKLCGDDGCGGTCGECPPAETCMAGRCVSKMDCTPQCSGKVCGDNGCGGICGRCAPGAVCVAGVCNANCTPQCTVGGLPKPCGSDGCGGQCIILGDKEVVVQDQNQSGYVVAPSNAPPRLDDALLTPISPRDIDDLQCAPGYVYDLDRIELHYEWYRNNSFFAGAGDVPVLDASLTSFGENWHCIIRATDGTEWAIPRKSSTRTIGNN